MPNPPTDLPSTGINSIGDLITALNVRYTQLNNYLKGFWQSPAIQAYDMGTFQINNLADPATDLDAVNLRTLKKYAGGSSSPAPLAPQYYTIVFDNSGTINTGDAVAAFKVGIGRAGAPRQVWLDAQTPPTADATFNFMVQIGGKGSFVPLLPVDLILPAGATSAFAGKFAVPAFPYLTRVYLIITNAGGAAIFSAGVVVQANS